VNEAPERDRRPRRKACIRNAGKNGRGARARFAPALALAAIGACFLSLAGVATAGTYRAAICSPSANEPLFIFEVARPAGSEGFHFKRECGMPFGGIRLVADSAAVKGAVRIGIDSAPNTTLKEIEYDRIFTPAGNGWSTLFQWTMGKFLGDTSIEFAQATAPPNGRVSHPVGGPMLFGELECLRGTGCGTANGTVVAEVDLANVVATVEDTRAPTIATTPPAAGTALSGTIGIPYEATDQGGGVELSRLLLDATPTAAAEDRDDNAGRCQQPFNFIRPCRTLVQRSFSLDTTQIPNGAHTLTPVAVDAAGNATPGQPFTVTIHNGPTSTARPALSGVPKVGEKLTATAGEWEGGPTAFAFQWLRCPVNVADGSEGGCEAIGGALAAEYVAQAADVGKRLVARVTASSASGADSALSAPTAPVADLGKGGGGGGGGGGGNGGGGGPGSAPETKIAKHPRSRTPLRVAKFAFSSNQSGSTFQCRLDKRPFKACRSPFKHKMKRGRHVFRVRAVSGGIADPTPARFSWRVL